MVERPIGYRMDRLVPRIPADALLELRDRRRRAFEILREFLAGEKQGAGYAERPIARQRNLYNLLDTFVGFAGVQPACADVEPSVEHRAIMTIVKL